MKKDYSQYFCRCKQHPKYRAIHKPRTLCEGCWYLWVDVSRFRIDMERKDAEWAEEMKAMGGKDRPTERCTVPYGRNAVCYGCDQYYDSHQ